MTAVVAVIFCYISTADLYRIVHVALNEYIHHVAELLQMKVVEAQFNSFLMSSPGKTHRGHRMHVNLDVKFSVCTDMEGH